MCDKCCQTGFGPFVEPFTERQSEHIPDNQLVGFVPVLVGEEVVVEVFRILVLIV